MTRPAQHFLVDLLLLLALVVWFFLVLVVNVVFPRGTQAAGWALWGTGYDQWCTFQFRFQCGFLVLVLVHLILQWRWVCSFLAGRWARNRGTPVSLNKTSMTVYGVMTLVVVLTILGIMVAVAEFMIVPAVG